MKKENKENGVGKWIKDNPLIFMVICLSGAGVAKVLISKIPQTVKYVYVHK